MSNTIRVVRRGAITHVYLPTGQELKGVINASVDIGPDCIGTLTLTFTDFSIDSSIGQREPNVSDRELASVGLKRSDYTN